MSKLQGAVRCPYLPGVLGVEQRKREGKEGGEFVGPLRSGCPAHETTPFCALGPAAAPWDSEPLPDRETMQPLPSQLPNQITAANAGKRFGFAGTSRVGLSPRPGVAEFWRSLRREVASTTAERGLVLTQPCLSRQVFYGSRRLSGAAHCNLRREKQRPPRLYWFPWVNRPSWSAARH